MYTPIKMEYSQKKTDIALEASIFPGKCHQNGGISMAMRVFDYRLPDGWKVEAPSRRMLTPKIGQEEIRRQFDLQQIFFRVKTTTFQICYAFALKMFTEKTLMEMWKFFHRLMTGIH